MRGEHTHEWHYNQVKQIQWTNGKFQYTVIRFCDRCLEVEEIELKELTNGKQPSKKYGRNKN